MSGQQQYSEDRHSSPAPAAARLADLGMLGQDWAPTEGAVQQQFGQFKALNLSDTGSGPSSPSRAPKPAPSPFQTPVKTPPAAAPAPASPTNLTPAPITPEQSAAQPGGTSRPSISPSPTKNTPSPSPVLRPIPLARATASTSGIPAPSPFGSPCSLPEGSTLVDKPMTVFPALGKLVSQARRCELPPSRTEPATGSPNYPTILLALTNTMPPAMTRTGWCLNDYVTIDKLYKGYASTVYKAFCKLSAQTVVLKVYTLAAVCDLYKFQIYREIWLHSHLQHENIISLYAAFQEGDKVVLVEEYADGCDLFNVMQKHGGRLSERLAVQMVLDPFIRVLHYLHSRGIIHRDIKPENILFTKDMRLKLGDFGLAIDLQEERPVTRAGTLDYMAPEVLKCPYKSHPDENKDNLGLHYCGGVDSWAVGVMTYELLAGYPPFYNQDRSSTESQIFSTMPTIPAGFSEEAREFVIGSLSKTPAGRLTVHQMLHHPWIEGYRNRRSMRMPRQLTGTNSFGASPQAPNPQQQQDQGPQEHKASSAAAAAAAAIAAVPLPLLGASLSPSSPSKHPNKEHKKMPASTATSLPEHLTSSYLPIYTPSPAHHQHQHSMAAVPDLGHPAGHVLIPAASSAAPGAPAPTTPSSLAQTVHPALQRQSEKQQDQGQDQQMEQGNGPVGKQVVAAAPSPTCPPQPLQMSRSVQSTEQSPQQQPLQLSKRPLKTSSKCTPASSPSSARQLPDSFQDLVLAADPSATDPAAFLPSGQLPAVRSPRAEQLVRRQKQQHQRQEATTTTVFGNNSNSPSSSSGSGPTTDLGGSSPTSSANGGSRSGSGSGSGGKPAASSKSKRAQELLLGGSTSLEAYLEQQRRKVQHRLTPLSSNMDSSNNNKNGSGPRSQTSRLSAEVSQSTSQEDGAGYFLADSTSFTSAGSEPSHQHMHPGSVPEHMMC